MKVNKVIISSGNDNYHMLFTASEIYNRKKLKKLICGIYPKNKYFFSFFQFINPIKRIFDRDYNINPKIIYSIWVSELLSKLSKIIIPFNFIYLRDKITAFSLYTFQLISVSFIKKILKQDIKIFHFRSGYGGSCIDFCKKKKIITLCDHGIVHPKILNYLINNKGKFPTQKKFEIKSNFWKYVNKDIQKSDYIIVNSDFVKKTFTHFNIPAKKVFVLYQGIENKFLKYLPKKNERTNSSHLKILFSGSLNKRKGIFDIQDSLKYLKDTQVELNFAGPVSSKDKTNLDILLNDKKVKYHGVLNKKSLAKLMHSNDIFILPTYAEGSARVIFEAMVAGCSIITTINSGSIVKHKKNGLIIDPGKPKQIANSIKYFMKNKAKIKIFGNNNIKIIKKHYLQKNYGDKLIKIYNKLI